MIKGSLEEALADSVFFIEADSFARQALWVMYSQRPDPTFPLKVEWHGNGCKGYGASLEGGTHVTCMFDFINGKQVCFYYPTSLVVDWIRIELFMEKYIAPSNHCNASNFAKCLSALRLA